MTDQNTDRQVTTEGATDNTAVATTTGTPNKAAGNNNNKGGANKRRPNNRPNGNSRSNPADTPKWEAVRALIESGEPTTVKVVGINTNAEGRPCGLNVTACELPGFLPGSELPKGVKQESLVGTELTVKVIEAARRKGRLIVSRKAVAEKEQSSFIQSLSEGAPLKGIIRRFKDGLGFFVEVAPGVDGLLHVSQVKKGVTLNIGDSVDLFVRRVDVEKGQVGLTCYEPRPEGNRTDGNRGGNRRDNGNAPRGRHGNSGAFGGGQSSRRDRFANLPKAPAKPAKPVEPSKPRALKTSTPKSKRAGFSVSFDNLQDAMAYLKEKHGLNDAPATEAPASETPTAVAEVPVTTAATEAPATTE